MLYLIYEIYNKIAKQYYVYRLDLGYVVISSIVNVDKESKADYLTSKSVG